MEDAQNAALQNATCSFLCWIASRHDQWDGFNFFYQFRLDQTDEQFLIQSFHAQYSSQSFAKQRGIFKINITWEGRREGNTGWAAFWFWVHSLAMHNYAHMPSASEREALLRVRQQRRDREKLRRGVSPVVEIESKKIQKSTEKNGKEGWRMSRCFFVFYVWPMYLYIDIWFLLFSGSSLICSQSPATPPKTSHIL